MKKIFLLACLLVTTICKVAATVQMDEWIVIGSDTMRLYSCPLEVYLLDHNLKSKDIPGLSEGLITSCWRGYVGVWSIEDNKLYLNEIRDPHRHGKVADLNEMFGDKYRDGKVLAEWCTDNIYVQYGNVVCQNDFIGRNYAREIKITISKGMVTESIDYPTLTATDRSGYIRIWDGKEIDSSDVISSLEKLVQKNFIWSDAMTENLKVDIVFHIDDDCSNTVSTKTEYEKRSMSENLNSFKKEYARNDNAKTKERLANVIVYCNTQIEEYEARIKEEYENFGVYLNELKRILTTAKVETMLHCGRPIICNYFEHSYAFDPESKMITAIRKSYTK